ncbi:MAG: hypothetical protein JNG85_00160 [Spirochaetaceae bacterium]|nr:hypothetical protein [Spirochaetaceae bacterium]
MIESGFISAVSALLQPSTQGQPGPGRRARRASGFDCLPDPLFIIDAHGDVTEMNRAARAFLASLPLEGLGGAVGRRELAELFSRAATRELGPAPLRVEGPEGVRHYEARFSEAGPGSKTALLCDITVYKEALAEKEALLRAVRADCERPIPVCARCGALRDEAGGWSAPGALSAVRPPLDRLSHGLCPACLAEELERSGLVQKAHVASAIRGARGASGEQGGR